MHQNLINVDKVNKDLGKFIKTLCLKNEELKNKVVRLEQESNDVTSINKELEQQVVTMMMSYKSYLVNQKSFQACC